MADINQADFQRISGILMTANPKNSPSAPHQGKWIPVRIIDVHDGDTIKFLMEINGMVMKGSLRVEGIDAPEITPKKGTVSDLEIQASTRIKQYVSNMFPQDSIQWIMIKGNDKYGGRYIGNIYCQKRMMTLSDHLIQLGCVKPYGGAKKAPWTVEELQMIDRKMLEILRQC